MVEIFEGVPAPEQADASVASVHLQDIFFATDLVLPLYPTLFDYGAAPTGLHLVPSFQVMDSAINRVEMTLELRRDESFEFQSDQQTVLFRVIHGQARVTSLGLSPKICTLRIDLEPQPSLVVLQVLCKRAGQTEFSGQEEIEGGLFLSIVNNSETGALRPDADPRDSEPLPDTIRITEIDHQERLRYKIFKSTVYTDLSMVSAGLEPELAFRVQQASGLGVKVSIDLPNLIFLPREDHPQEVALDMLGQTSKPGDLHVGFLLNDGGPTPRGCDIQWTSPSDPVRRNFFVTSFSMEVHELTNDAQEFLRTRDWKGTFDVELLKLLAALIKDPEFLKLLRKVGAADPTIIDTPTCTEINGRLVCSA